MAELGEATVAIRASFEKFDKDVKGARGLVDKALSGLATGGALAAAAGVAAIGAAAVKTGYEVVQMASDFQEATNAIIVGTGATGDSLAEMEQIVKNLKGQPAGLGREFGELGAVVAEVNTRTGATGESLEEMSAQILNLSRLTGGDAVKNTQLITRVMGDWGVEAENSAELMDSLFGASQAFGVSVDSLSYKLVQFGAPLRQMGFSLEESIALFGKWEQEGVNTELVLGSLRIAAGKFAKENIDLRDGLQGTIDAIKNANNESEGLAIAMEVFGARAGPDMAAAIREGRFELDAAIESLSGTSGGLEDATDRALSLQDRFTLLKDSVLLALMPIGDAVLELAEQYLPKMQEIMKEAQPVIEEFAARFAEDLGPAIAAILANVRGMGEAMGVVNEEMTDGEAVATTLGAVLSKFLDIVEGFTAKAEDFVSFWSDWGFAVKQLINPFGTLLSQVGELDAKLVELSSSLPDWMTPGSPTPLELGLRGITDAANKLPDFSSKFNVEPSFGGIGNAGMVDNSRSIGDINANATINSGGSVDEALTAAFKILRAKVNEAGASA